MRKVFNFSKKNIEITLVSCALALIGALIIDDLWIFLGVFFMLWGNNVSQSND